MAITENYFDGDGSNLGPFTFTFSWLDPSDIYVSVGGVVKAAGTHYNLQALNYATKSGGQVLFTAGNAPPVGTGNIRIFRETDDTTLTASFVSGSAIRAQDLNGNFLQSIYVAQETKRDSDAAIAEVSQGVEDAAQALSNSQTAINTANNAETSADTAIATANSANTTATTATNTANDAVSTANTALNAANQAVTTADSASLTATSAQTASTNAVNTANAADATANQALNLVSAVVDYDIISNVAAIPSSPADGDGVELLDSTGIQSFSPLTGVPAGFIGSSDLRVKIKYNATGSTWEWISYVAADPEARYVNSTNGVISNSLGIGTSSPTTPLHVAGIARIGANDTSNAELEIGAGATGNRNAFIDLVTDTTYTDYGLRIIRGDGGPNTPSFITHRGISGLWLVSEDAGTLNFATNSQERARIDSSGRLLVGTNSARDNFYNTTATTQQQIEGDGSLSLVRNQDNTFGSVLILGKSRSSSNTIVEDDDVIGDITFQGNDGSEFVSCAGIYASVDGTPGANDMPGRIVLSTTPSGSTTPQERMRINADGTTVFSYPVTIPAGSTIDGYQRNFNHIGTFTDTTITDHTWVSVLAAGLTITLPASATDGMAVRISVGDFTNTVINGNGLRIMNDPSNLTIDRANATVTLVYDAYAAGPVPSYGWRII